MKRLFGIYNTFLESDGFSETSSLFKSFPSLNNVPIHFSKLPKIVSRNCTTNITFLISVGRCYLRRYCYGFFRP